MAVPVIYRRTTEASANYDYFDLATGTGWRTYYPAAARISSATLLSTQYFLTSRNLGSDSDATCYTFTSLTNEVVELNFDLEFRNALVIQGDAFLNFTIQLHKDVNPAWLVFTFYHVSTTGVETQIGTASTSPITGNGTDVWCFRRLCKVTLANKKFSPGEKFRLEAKLCAINDSMIVWHDPDSRGTMTETSTSATIGTDFVVEVPFKIDI